MGRRMILLVCLAGVLGLANSVAGLPYTWTNLGSGNSWCTSGNWDPSTGVPGTTDPCDTVTIPGSVAVGPVIGSGCEPNVYNMGAGPAAGEEITVTIDSGGSLIVQQPWNWGSDSEGTATVNISGDLTILGGGGASFRMPDNGNGYFNIYPGANIYVEGTMKAADAGNGYGEVHMYGGDVNVGEFEIGDEGSGNFYMTGGTFISRAGFGMRGWGGGYMQVLIDGGAQLLIKGAYAAPDDDEAFALIDINDGYVECRDWLAQGYWTLDINDGMLRIKDPTTEPTPPNSPTQEMLDRVQGWIDTGKITGYNGTVTPQATTDGLDVVVTVYFTHLKAWDASPGHNATDVCPNDVVLKWAPGDYCVDDHNVYFGSSLSDVNESATPILEHYDSNSWAVPYELELGTTYYWRVDEVNDSCDASPWTGGIWRFTTENGQAYDPSPVDGYRRIGTAGLALSWSPSCVADAHRVYFGTDLPESITLFEDDFESGAFEPNWTNSGWGIWDANDDPCWADFGEHDHNLARATAAGVKTLTSINIDTSDYAKAIQVRFFVRRTESVRGDELELSYYDGSSYDVVNINDFNVVAFGPNETWYEFTDTITDSQYMINNFRIRLTANLDSGDDTVWIDDVRVSNSWPIDPKWFIQEQPADDTNYVPSVEPFVHYYWRIDEVIDGNWVQGGHWDFSTGFGGLLLYYKFDGSDGSPLPNPITDDSGNNIQFTKYAGGGSVTYGESNPIVNADDGTSADFDPNVGLYRDDPCRYDPNGWDLLRLDGWQYTIELWFKVNEGDYDEEEGEDMMLIGKTLNDDWSIMISDLGNDDDFRWYHNGDDQEVGGLMTSDMRDKWIHVAAVYDRSLPSERQKLYINGVLEETGDDSDLNPADNNDPVTIGYEQEDDVNVGAFFSGLIDEIRIYDIALTPCDFLLSPGPEWAGCPSPYDTEMDVDPCAPGFKLSWKPGIYADKHDIYFGTSASAVGDLASPYVADHDSNSWTPPETLELGKPYFWRVDEKTDDPCGDSPWKGEPWYFLTRLPIEEPQRILWYRLDESGGEIALDSSGYSHHGDIEFDDDDIDAPSWEPNDGHVGGCLKFDDDTRIEAPSDTLASVTSQITVAVWLNGLGTQTRNKDMTILDAGFEGNPRRMTVYAPDEDDNVYWRAGNDTNDVLVWNDATPRAWRGDWHHFAFVKDEVGDKMSIYFDGVEVKSKSGTIASLANVRFSPIRIGAVVWHSYDYEGKIDDLRIYDVALTEDEIAALFRGGDLERAWAPNPYDGQPDASYDTDLSWRRGDYAASHDVYFGTDWDEVNDANSSIHPNVDHNNVTDTNYTIGLLDLDTYYYWRVDEVNDACDPNGWKGYIWRFKTADYIVIDDMEDYTETKDYPVGKLSGATDWGWDSAYENYTGALLYLSCATCQWGRIYNGGDQAMYYYYDLTDDWGCGYYYSEISNHFDMEPNDWNARGLKMLTLWFLGDPCNTASGIEQMYVGLEDSGGSGSYSEVRYGDGIDEEVNDIAIAEWQPWNIPLSNFTSVNLEDVAKLYIGFGERYGSQIGGSGNVYFDDIRLYPPTCVPWIIKPELDWNDDCIVDFGEIQIMAEDWLKADVNLGEVTQPSDSNLIAWWTLDEGSGSDVNDYSGNDHNGVIETIDTDVYWIAGRNDVNYALDFDGGRVRVADHPQLRSLQQVSVSAWIKPTNSHDNDARIVVKGADNKETYGLELGSDDNIGFKVRDGNDPNAGSFPNYAAEGDEDDEIDYGEWIHAAGTYDGNSVRCYVNGELTAENNDANAIAYFGHPLSQDTNDLAIGNRSDATNRQFVGIIDDVRVYDYGLSAQEVAYLASDGTGIVAVESIANLAGGEPAGERAVNFRDLAILGQSWLEEELYP